MIKVRIHGRGGQGVVTAAYVLGLAGFSEGLEAQAFPKFGAERTGAPIESYIRLGRKSIKIRTPVEKPDYVLVFDSTLAETMDVGKGLNPKGFILINTSKKIKLNGKKVYTVNLQSIIPGINSTRMLNMAVLAAFVAITNTVKVDSLTKAIGQVFSGDVSKKNREIVEKVYTKVRKEMLLR